MPRNKDGEPIDPTEYNRSDGFSPGNLIITKVPGLDTPAAFQRTGAVPITDIGRTYDRRQPIVVINTRTKQAPPDLVGARREPHQPGGREPADPSRA